jgi:hypothetical protein
MALEGSMPDLTMLRARVKAASKRAWRSRLCGPSMASMMQSPRSAGMMAMAASRQVPVRGWPRGWVLPLQSWRGPLTLNVSPVESRPWDEVGLLDSARSVFIHGEEGRGMLGACGLTSEDLEQHDAEVGQLVLLQPLHQASRTLQL